MQPAGFETQSPKELYRLTLLTIRLPVSPDQNKTRFQMLVKLSLNIDYNRSSKLQSFFHIPKIFII